PDVPAPGPLRTDHADGRRAAPVARPLRLSPPGRHEMSDATLDAIRTIIQEDVNNRGLRTDPNENLVTACPQDFAAACRSLAGTEQAPVAVVTGFFIPHGQPPCGETDGPLGALFLARALVPLGMRVVLVTDGFCVRALEAGLAAAGLRKSVAIVP